MARGEVDRMIELCVIDSESNYYQTILGKSVLLLLLTFLLQTNAAAYYFKNIDVRVGSTAIPAGTGKML
jgi:hypothetical protein